MKLIFNYKLCKLSYVRIHGNNWVYKVSYATHVHICTHILCAYVGTIGCTEMYGVSCVHVVIHTHVSMYASMYGNK